MKAAIDVGSNTVRMMLGTVRNGRIVPERYLRRITRLGGGYRPDTGIAAEAAERTVAALVEFAQVIKAAAPDQVRAVATEAVRRSGNAAEFVALVRQRTGLELEVIAGATEALLSAQGVVNALDPLPAACLIFDIGGGSTEFILLRGRECLFHRSYPLGVVALAESSQAATTIAAVLEQLCADLEDARQLATVLSPDCLLVGTAGTVTTLAAIELEMAVYDWRRVNNLSLSRERIVRMHRQLSGLAPAAREQIVGMEAGRGDLIVHGMEIVLGLTDCLRKDGMKVSDFGLLEGVLISIG